MNNKLNSLTKLIVVSTIVLFSFSAKAQVGINTNTPAPSAVLDLTSANQGLLVPRVSDLNEVIKPTAIGLLVYNTTDNTFYFYNDGWYAVNPFNKLESSSDITVKSGDNIVVESGNITASSGTITANTFVGNGTIPVGGIIMWSGSIASIPLGWALCNGTNGTPNLSGQFIVGYNPISPDYNAIGKTGGAKYVILTAAQSGLPAHNHEINDPGHAHYYTNWPNQYHATSNNNRDDHPYSENHKETSQTTASSPTGITIKNSISENATDSHENRPPYYVLAYIMRIK